MGRKAEAREGGFSRRTARRSVPALVGEGGFDDLVVAFADAGGLDVDALEHVGGVAGGDGFAEEIVVEGIGAGAVVDLVFAAGFAHEGQFHPDAGTVFDAVDGEVVFGDEEDVVLEGEAGVAADDVGEAGPSDLGAQGGGEVGVPEVEEAVALGEAGELGGDGGGDCLAHGGAGEVVFGEGGGPEVDVVDVGIRCGVVGPA